MYYFKKRKEMLQCVSKMNGQFSFLFSIIIVAYNGNSQYFLLRFIHSFYTDKQ